MHYSNPYFKRSEKRDSRRPLTVRDVSLIRLAKNGDLDSIKQMIKEGVNINEQDETGWTVLHEACVRNLPRMVDYLLRHGADPSISNISGEMALHCAARVGCLRIVRALIYYNADPLVSNHRGEKPLDLCHDPEVSSFLKQVCFGCDFLKVTFCRKDCVVGISGAYQADQFLERIVPLSIFLRHSKNLW
ncbi:unnamed protein product [Schistosoma curassoni]|uniref:ANK_REP_REGION domain-containing protein n=1 Tax=Schistosoma curassoni TaxID=6186 RepID=A0A183JRV1_9TREM|nr:unnamed protein product [Schistosoma curassoni]